MPLILRFAVVLAFINSACAALIFAGQSSGASLWFNLICGVLGSLVLAAIFAFKKETSF